MEPNQVDANLLYSLFMVFTGFVLQSLLPMAYCSVNTGSVPTNLTLCDARGAKMENVSKFLQLLVMIYLSVAIFSAMNNDSNL